MHKVSIDTRKCACVSLKNFDANYKEADFIEVTRWSNYEGYDISTKDKVISVSCAELEAVNYLVKTLEYGLINNN